MKRKVFFGLSGGLGPVLRCLPIAQHFRQAGDQVYFSVYGASSARFIEKLGYAHLADDDPTLPSPDKKLAAGPVIYNLDHYYAQTGLLDESFAEAWIKHRIRMIERVKADLIYADMSPHTVIAARYHGIPVVSVTQSCFHPRGERVYSWGETPRNLPKVTPVVNKILSRLKLPQIHSMEELNTGDVDLVPGIPEMDPIDDLNVRYVGQLAYKFDAKPLKGNRSMEPYILVYPGRLQDSAGSSGLKLVKYICQAFAYKNQPVVIATNEPLPRELGKRRFNNIRFIPYFTEDILNNCSLFIHHGGHGSCLSAVMAGVPSLVVPTQTEREYNARKLQELGAGEYMLPDTFTSAHLYGMSHFIMRDEYRHRTEQLRSVILARRYGGASEAYESGRRLFFKHVQGGRK